VNQTCESVDVEVPTASLLPGVQVGAVPGAPAGIWAWRTAGMNAIETKT
jgi:hypothetical protein